MLTMLAAAMPLSVAKADVTSTGNTNGWHVRASRISCVPFARRESGVDLTGNAYQWWQHAQGIYARGKVPQRGSVLAFRPTARMRLGHVAVVTRVLNPREVEVDQANWPHGTIERGIAVVDVSEWNDWSKVRVAIGHTKTFGSIYPTYGFIYDRPDDGRFLVASRQARPVFVLDTRLSKLWGPPAANDAVARTVDTSPAHGAASGNPALKSDEAAAASHH